MRPSLPWLALGLACVLQAQESGVVDNKVVQSFYARYPIVLDLSVDRQVRVPTLDDADVQPSLAPGGGTRVVWRTTTLLTRDMPVPTTGNLNTSTSITKSQAIAMGVDPTVILNFEQNLDPEISPTSVRYSVTTRGSYVGKSRRTLATITQGTDGNLNDWDYSRYVGEKLQSFGWSWVTAPARIDSSAFTGPSCVVNNSGADLVFYAGHGYSNGGGPAVPGNSGSVDFVRQFNWGLSNGSTRGARWFFMQSCEWFRPEYESGLTTTPANGPNRWTNAFNSGFGSLHGIFGYSSQAWLIGRSVVANYPGFHSTNLAPVAALSNMNQYGGGLGDSWFLGSRNQTEYQYGGGPGAIPAVLTLSNSKCGDYFYETFSGTVDSPGMYPDPMDVPDPNAMLVFHYQYIYSSMNGNPPWF